MKRFEEGQKVQWIDPVSKEKRTGLLVERMEVVAVAGLDLRFRDTSHYSWDVAEWGTGKPFSIPEKDLMVVREEKYEN